MNQTKNLKRTAFFVIGLISFIQFILLLFISNIKSIGYDDSFQLIANTLPSLKETLYFLIAGDNNPPLFTFLTLPWTRIAPHGTLWLKMPNILFVCAATFLCGVIGYQLKGYWGALFASLFSASSFQAMQRGAQCLRPYGLFYFTSALTLLLYLKRRENQEDKTHTLLYCGSLILLAYSHYFGVLICIGLFLCDFILFLMKKIPWTVGLCYLVAAITYLPWIVPFMLNYMSHESTFSWTPVPGVSEYVELYLAANNNLFQLILYVFGAVLILIFLMKSCLKLLSTHKKTDITPQNYFLFICYSVPFFVITTIYIYSKYINPEESLWADRYFVGIMPYFILAMSYSISTIMIYLLDKITIKHKNVLSHIVFIILSTYLITINAVTLFEFEHVVNDLPYEDIADFLSQQDDLYEEHVIAVSTNGSQNPVWQYFSTQETPIYDKIIGEEEFASDSDISESITKIYLLNGFTPHDAFQQILSDYYVLQKEYKDICIQVYTKKE